MTLLDGRKRTVEYLRLSVTDRCNLRCFYCMPEEGVQKLSHEAILTDVEILRVAGLLLGEGIRTIRVTGGEPLIRHGITGLVGGLADLGVPDLAMTTNGTLLAGLASKLASAGLGRVNVSLDTLRPERFSRIARRGKFSDVLAGIDAALGAGLNPVKINVVVLPGVNDDELPEFFEFARRRPVHVRFIEHMPVFDNSVAAHRFNLPEAVFRILGDSPASAEVAGIGPAESFTLSGMAGSIGMISAVSRCFCDRCNRVRIYANGDASSCLFSQSFFDLKGLMRSGASDAAILAGIGELLTGKPSSHGGEFRRTRPMSTIGG